MSHLLLNCRRREIPRADEVEKKTEAADKGISPQAPVFNTLSQSVLVERCSVMITSRVYGMHALAMTVCSMPFIVMTNQRTQASG